MKSSVNGFTAQAFALAAALGLSLGGPHRAQAAPANPVVQAESGPEITILNPAPQTSFSGVKPVEISAFYQGSSDNQIVALELYIDGTKAAQKVLENPEIHGVVSFLVDASAITPGNHEVVVRATAADAEITSAKTSFVFETPAPVEDDTPVAVPDGDQGAPRLSIQNPSVGGSVQGTVRITVQATDPSGNAPYVSLFIDREWKSLRNYAPYDFTWDTTSYSNGYHTVEAFGYNDDQQVGHSEPLRILVNNPGGRTERRTDLLDTPPAAPKTAARPVATRFSVSGPVREALRNEQGLRPAGISSVSAPTAKATLSRRPIRSALIASRSTVTPLQAEIHSVQLVDLSALTQQNMALIGSSSLTNPFVDSLVPMASEHRAKHMEALSPVVAAVKAKPEMAIAGWSSNGVQQHHVRIVSFQLPDEALVSPFGARSIVGTPTNTLKVMTTVRSVGTGRNVMVAIPVVQPSQRIFVHEPRLARSYNWLLAAGQRTVVFNSSWMTLQRPLTAQGSILFGPLRQIFEADGGSLLWQGRTGVVVGHDKDRDVKLTIGRKSATINQTNVELDKAPYIRNGRTMVPLSFLKEAMNVDVQYDPATGHLMITNNQQ